MFRAMSSARAARYCSAVGGSLVLLEDPVVGAEGDAEARLRDRGGEAAPVRRAPATSTTMLTRRPTPSTSTSTVSPGKTGRECHGVPVSTTSPGRRVMWRVRSAKSSSIPQTISETARLLDLLRRSRTSAAIDRRMSTPLTSAGPMGQKPSCPLTRSIEPASVSRKSCAPTSLAQAKPARWSHTSSARTRRIVRPTTAAISPS